MKKFIINRELHQSYLKLRFIYYNLHRSCSTTKSEAKSENYKDTILLPKTNFPRRYDFNYEESIAKDGLFSKLYLDQSKLKNSPKFILHDGPPYANGPLHIGHVINKILKDIICRYKYNEGYVIDFKPGYDCHGLPIESKAIKILKSKKSPNEIREECKKISEDSIKIQTDLLKKLGLMVDWTNFYRTSDQEYIIKELDVFGKLFEDKLIYKQYMPVHWSPSNATALAEAELEYNPQHVGYSVYVKYKLANFPKEIFSKDVYALIWTTQPWTLLTNQAIAFSTSTQYCIVKNSAQQHFLVAEKLISDLEKSLNSSLEKLFLVENEVINSLKYFNPLTEEYSPIINSDHVTLDKGTGLVHVAPNHGHDDYFAVIKNNIQINDCVVDEYGKFTEDSGTKYSGKFVLEEGSEKVIQEMQDSVVSCDKNYIHNYPYDWRSKKPIIIRASQQWFLDINSLRDDCLGHLKNVKFYPESLKKTLETQIKERPSWCISRQRVWGIPIPVFYSKEDTKFVSPKFSPKFLNHIQAIYKKSGINSWWNMPNSELFPENLLKEMNLDTNCENWRRGEDIFDIWFDSGSSWYNALDGKIADLYLEGCDQIRGWFQSSLFLGSAMMNKSPFKEVFIHGFVLDENKNKMSKSLNNVVDPEDLLNWKKNGVGVDSLRFWIAKSASDHSNVPFKMSSLKDCHIHVSKLRNYMRFCLGFLDTFNHNYCPDINNIRSMDKYILHILEKYSKEMEDSYLNYNIKNITNRTLYLMNEVTFYFSVIKDKLYCDEPESHSRKSIQTSLYFILRIISRYMDPIVPHLISQVKEYYPNLFEEEFSKIKNRMNWNNEEIKNTIDLFYPIREKIATYQTGTPLKNYDVHILCKNNFTEDKFNILQREHFSTSSTLCELLEVSTVRKCKSEEEMMGLMKIFDMETEDFNIKLGINPASALNNCPRCRRFVAETKNELCSRCSFVLNHKSEDIKLKI